MKHTWSTNVSVSGKPRVAHTSPWQAWCSTCSFEIWPFTFPASCMSNSSCWPALILGQPWVHLFCRKVELTSPTLYLFSLFMGEGLLLFVRVGRLSSRPVRRRLLATDIIIVIVMVKAAVGWWLFKNVFWCWSRWLWWWKFWAWWRHSLAFITFFHTRIILLEWLGCRGVTLFYRHLVEVIPALKLINLGHWCWNLYHRAADISDAYARNDVIWPVLELSWYSLRLVWVKSRYSPRKVVIVQGRMGQYRPLGWG